MDTDDFSVPDVEEKRRKQNRAAAIDALFELRKEMRPVSDEVVRRAWQVGRP
ncbi:MAG TPA: hypothetical protein VE685_03830 [Thermoanaerobaculia bacterium]|nr:hypothetical protein [Thermoanaerobaculia bacterium]